MKTTDNRPREINGRALDEAVEIVQRLQRDEEKDIPEAAVCVAGMFGWNVAQTTHLMTHLTFVEAYMRNRLVDTDHLSVRISRLAVIHDKIEAALPGERHLDFAAYIVELIPMVGRVPFDNLDEVVVRGRVAFSWKPEFLSEVVENPTWLDVAVIADSAIEETEAEHQDLHGVEETGRMTGGGDAIYELTMTTEATTNRWSAR
jgi:hypothetical protein